jgi:hypothetical protein
VIVRHKTLVGAVVFGIIAVVVVAAIYGGLTLFDVRPQRSGSWAAYFGVAIVVGVVGIVGEVIAEVVLRGDRVTDPLAKRAGRLALVLISAAFLASLIYWLASGV